jgi:hypothetical protein
MPPVEEVWAENRLLKGENAVLKAEMAWLKRQMFGPGKSENSIDCGATLDWRRARASARRGNGIVHKKTDFHRDRN